MGMAECQNGLHRMPQAVGIFLLLCYRRRIRSRVYRQIQGFRRRVREAQVFPRCPLHGSTGTGAEIATLFGGQFLVPHTNFVAIIEERCSRHSKQHGVGNAQFVGGQPGCRADGIVVAGNQAVQAVFMGRFIAGQPVIQELVNAGTGILAEIRLADVVRIGIHGAVISAHKPVITVMGSAKHKVHVKTVLQGQTRRIPLTDQCRLRILFLQHGGNVPPDGTGILFVMGIVFDKAERHIHPETVTAHGQPEAHHILDGFHRSTAIRCVGGLLPDFMNFAIAIVQGRLALEEVQDIRTVAVGLAADKRHTVTACKAVIGPDVPAGVFILLHLAAGFEPGVFLTGMAGHQIQQHMHALFVGCAEQLGQILVGSVAGGHLLVVPHIVAGIFEGGVKAGVDPQGIAAQTFNIVQFGSNARQVADAIPVCIAETLRINLIKHCIFEPLLHSNPPESGRFQTKTPVFLYTIHSKQGCQLHILHKTVHIFSTFQPKNRQTSKILTNY